MPADRSPLLFKKITLHTTYELVEDAGIVVFKATSNAVRLGSDESNQNRSERISTGSEGDISS